MSSDNSHELIIIGAGVSGLGFAHLARQKGLHPLVLEASSHIGGCIDSHQFETTDGCGWVELGAHTCFNSYGTLLGILEGVGEVSNFQAKEKFSYQLLTPEGLTSIPRALNFVEILRSVIKLFSLDKAKCTVEQYFGAIVGPNNFQKVVAPALDAVICQPAAQFPANALFRKKPRKKEIQRSFTGKRGVQSFVDAIAEQEGLNIRSSSPVKSITRDDRGFSVLLESGESLEAEQVALAVPPDIVARLLANSVPAIANLAAEIEMAEIESLAVVTAAEAVPLPKMAGIIAQSDHFYSAVSRDPIADPHFRAFTFHFRPNMLAVQQQLQRACEVLEITPDQVTLSRSKHNRLPMLRIGHDKRVAQLDALLQSEALAITGNWFEGVSIEDALLRTAAEVERLFPG